MCVCVCQDQFTNSGVNALLRHPAQVFHKEDTVNNLNALNICCHMAVTVSTDYLIVVLPAATKKILLQLKDSSAMLC